MASFTPGPWVPNDQHSGANPWRVESDDGISKNDGWIIADLLGPDAEANTSLIAAAPALYEALEQISRGEGRFHRDPLTHAENCIEDMKSIALAALAQARGNSI